MSAKLTQLRMLHSDVHHAIQTLRQFHASSHLLGQRLVCEEEMNIQLAILAAMIETLSMPGPGSTAVRVLAACEGKLMKELFKEA